LLTIQKLNEYLELRKMNSKARGFLYMNQFNRLKCLW